MDANVLIYAYVKPKRALTEEEKKIKQNAKKIIERVSGGEKVVTTVIHLSEVANVLENAVSAETLSKILTSLFSMDNVDVAGVSREEYLLATDMAPTFGIGINDALAAVKMKKAGASEIYSFDKHFDAVADISRIES
ncbi:MAG: type II toxin-antitoxin system VapC family toxin [Candidatus Hadarchaeota archaeon]